MPKFEVRTETVFGSLFRHALASALEEAGFVKVGDIALPQGPHIQEFRKRGVLLTVSHAEVSDGKDHLVVDSDSASVADLVRAAVNNGAAEFCSVFLAALTSVPEAEVRKRTKLHLQDL